jgi:hypothetical protein
MRTRGANTSRKTARSTSRARAARRARRGSSALVSSTSGAPHGRGHQSIESESAEELGEDLVGHALEQRVGRDVGVAAFTSA